MTVITKTIGSSGRDYATVTLFQLALPVDLVSADESWVGLCYNDSEFTNAGEAIFDTSSGYVTDATHMITLTAAPGQSWIDQADAATAPIRYDVSRGVGFHKYDSYDALAIIHNSPYVIVSRIQGMADNPTTSGFFIVNNSENTIFGELLSFGVGGGAYLFSLYGAGTLLRNSIGYLDAPDGGGLEYGGGSTILASAIIRTAAQPAFGTAFVPVYPNSDILESCVCLGFTTPAGAGFDVLLSKNNSTDQAAGLPGLAPVYNVPFSGITPFVLASGAGTVVNLQPVAGTPLINAGAYEAVLAPSDIIGVARAPLTVTIGSRQYVSPVAAHRDAILPAFIPGV